MGHQKKGEGVSNLSMANPPMKKSSSDYCRSTESIEHKSGERRPESIAALKNYVSK